MSRENQIRLELKALGLISRMAGFAAAQGEEGPERRAVEAHEVALRNILHVMRSPSSCVKCGREEADVVRYIRGVGDPRDVYTNCAMGARREHLHHVCRCGFSWCVPTLDARTEEATP